MNIASYLSNQHTGNPVVELKVMSTFLWGFKTLEQDIQYKERSQTTTTMQEDEFIEDENAQYALRASTLSHIYSPPLCQTVTPYTA